MEPLDWNALKENCAGDESLVNEVLDLFRQEAKGLLADVRTAVSSKDPVAVKKTAHRLKGALVSLAAAPSVEAARELEKAGMENAPARFEPGYLVLEKEMARLMSALSVANAA
jgi:HPt (histidine-containing phosphotransfer) domain-containing protein